PKARKRRLDLHLGFRLERATLAGRSGGRSKSPRAQLKASPRRLATARSVPGRQDRRLGLRPQFHYMKSAFASNPNARLSAGTSQEGFRNDLDSQELALTCTRGLERRSVTVA